MIKNNLNISFYYFTFEFNKSSFNRRILNEHIFLNISKGCCPKSKTSLHLRYYFYST